MLSNLTDFISTFEHKDVIGFISLSVIFVGAYSKNTAFYGTHVIDTE